MYGTQTRGVVKYGKRKFENDVKMYGTQTVYVHTVIFFMFENDVKMYGTQTYKHILFITM